MGFWMIVAIILLVLILIWFTTLRIFLTYGRMGENDHLVIEVTAWRKLLHYKYELPIMTLQPGEDGPQIKAKVEKVNHQDFAEREGQMDTPKAKKWYHNYEKVLRRVRDLQPIAKQMLKQVHCDKLEWHTTLGSGDAAETGALTGMVWTVKSLILSGISHHILLGTIPKVSVQPIWNRPVIQTQLRCIFHFRLGHALIAGVRILLRLRKGRGRLWRTALFRV